MSASGAGQRLCVRAFCCLLPAAGLLLAAGAALQVGRGAVGEGGAHLWPGPVCGVDGANYSSVEAATAAGVAVLNCAPCGACSTAQDVGVYRRTAGSLIAAVRSCGLRWGAARQRACLEGLGLTPGCAACFWQNIECDRRNCLAALLASHARRLWALAWGRQAPEPTQESLASNRCLACDEARCGPAFMECAGANRRQAGIVSDIARDEAELCREAVHYQDNLEATASKLW